MAENYTYKEMKNLSQFTKFLTYKRFFIPFIAETALFTLSMTVFPAFQPLYISLYGASFLTTTVIASDRIKTPITVRGLRKSIYKRYTDSLDLLDKNEYSLTKKHLKTISHDMDRADLCAMRLINKLNRLRSKRDKHQIDSKAYARKDKKMDAIKDTLRTASEYDKELTERLAKRNIIRNSVLLNTFSANVENGKIAPNYYASYQQEHFGQEATTDKFVEKYFEKRENVTTNYSATEEETIDNENELSM